MSAAAPSDIPCETVSVTSLCAYTQTAKFSCIRAEPIYKVGVGEDLTFLLLHGHIRSVFLISNRPILWLNECGKLVMSN